jgi:hypothetical protein
MNIREISDVFKDTADEITAIKSYNFGWASDRVRQGNTEDFQELNEFPRIFFSVPTITGSDQTRKQDTYQVTLFFDDLLGYDNEGDEDPTLQIDKWANLQQYANYFIQRLNKIKQSILPNYLFIPEAPSITFDSFTGIQRMITVQLSFNLVVPTNCDPGVITLVQCIANIVTSSNLTASLKSIIKFAASLEGRATVTADIALVQKVASSLNANAFLSGDINFVQKAQASLLTSANVTGNIIIPKLVQASLTGAGITAANLTVGGAFDADAQAFFDRVTAAGGTLNATERTAVNTLVVQMKADGIWTKMKAIYPMVGGGQANPAAACAQNLKSASFTGSFSGGWTHSSNGPTPNGTNAYMDTNLTPSSSLIQDSTHLSFYSRTNIANQAQFEIGSFNISTAGQGSSSFGISYNSPANTFRLRISSSTPTTTYTVTNTLGFFIGNRTNATQQKIYNAGVLGNTFSANSNGLSTLQIALSANRISTVTLGDYSQKQCAFASIGDGLTDAEAANFYSAVQAFQTTLNRQV